MTLARGRGALPAFGSAAILAVLVATARCGPPEPDKANTERVVLRLGVSNAPSLSADRGVQQFISNISNEGLLRVNQEGRLEPALAEGWKRSDDGLLLTINLRPNVRFHDGSPVDAASVAQILNDTLPKTLKASFDDIESIKASSDRVVDIRFRRASSFVADSFIDMPIQKAGGVGTGAFMAARDGTFGAGGRTEVVAFDDYYLGRPAISKIAISTYPSGRAAWADLLRDQIDMLSEVGADAIEAMRGATNVSLYTFERPYQYVMFLNPRSPKLKSRTVRQGLNEAMDRAALVRDALGGHGTPSVGPVSPKHWAFSPINATFTYAPQEALAKIGKPFVLTCVTLADAPFDKLALSAKQQLKAVGVDLQIREAPLEDAFSMLTKNDVEAVLVDSVSGWSLLRAYRWWHSQGPSNVSRFSNPTVDAALDQVNHATNDEDYRAGVKAFQQAIADDPPAIFLAWSDRSRAISNRFDVEPQAGRDVLATLRQWHPSADKGSATQN